MEKATGETRPDVAIAARIERDDFGLDVDITSNAGDVIGITGDIGTGKSSVLWLVAGRLQAASGAVIVDGEAWDDPAASIFRAERPACLLSQTFHNDLPEELTGVEAVCGAIGRISPDLDAPAAESLARATLAGLGVEEHVVDRLPWTFSGAEAQRVALARAIAPSPRVLLLDEPFGALDKRTGQSVRTWLAEWLADYDGIALIASTNDADLAVLCDRIIHLE